MIIIKKKIIIIFKFKIIHFLDNKKLIKKVIENLDEIGKFYQIIEKIKMLVLK